MSDRVAVVTGSNSGLGFAIVKILCLKFKGVVYLTSPCTNLGKTAVSKLNKLKLYPDFHQLDITSRESITKFRDHIVKKHGGIDIVINNAGIITISSVFNKTNYEHDKHIIDTNFKSMFIIQELLFPLVRENGRILNISSNAGHLSNVRNEYWIKRLSKTDLKVEDINEFVNWYLESSKNGTFVKHDIADNGAIAAYKVSKVAICALTRLQQKELEFKNISVNSLHPGIMRTKMTLGFGCLSPDQAAKTPVYLVLDAPQSLKGQYVWFDRKSIDWCDYSHDVVYYKKLISDNLIFYSLYATLTNNYRINLLKIF